MSGVRSQVSGVRYQVSGVRCQLWGVRCQVSCVIFLFFFGGDKEVGLVSGRSVVNRGLPRLVYLDFERRIMFR